MASQQVVVEVHNGGKVVDGPFSRPVRLLPDGAAGVVYGGDVYPLYKDGRIDLADESVDKWSCPSFVLAGQAVPYARSRKPKGKSRLKIRDWYLESNKFGHYLVFDAAETTAAAVADLMGECGLGVRRWDASTRPAEDGVQYDWFIRLEFTGSREECLERVRAALSVANGKKKTKAAATLAAAPQAHAAPALNAATELAVHRAVIDELTASLKEAERQRVAAVRRADESARQAADAEERVALAHATGQDAASRLDESRKTQKKLRSELLKTRKELTDARLQPSDIRADGDVAALREENARVRAEVDDALQAFIDADSRSVLLSDEVAVLTSRVGEEQQRRAALEAQLSDAFQQLQETQTESREAATAAAARSGRRRESVESFLEKLLPRLRLDPDSVETLLGFPKPLAALKLLVRLHDNDDSLPKERLKESAFFELADVHTGESGDSRMGRIYYAVDDAGLVQARIHRKKNEREQQRFIKSLRLAA